MKIYKKEVSELWLKAAVVGSLWGSLEIIVGSFFHNIRLPMAGTVLAFLGVSLLIAFGQIWKDKGLFWRAALIAAMMKSVSPSAVLIGPMTGIFLEGILIEGSTRLLGRNYIGFLIGGILALYSVVLHKIITFLVMYGFDIVRIIENMYRFAQKQLHSQNLSFGWAFFILTSAYIVFGIAASILGFYIGKRAKKQSKSSKNTPEFKPEMLDRNIQTDDKAQSLPLLFIHLILIISGLALMNFVSFTLALIFSAIYLGFCLIKYKRSVRYLKRPMFWVQMLILVAVSAMFYNGFQADTLYDKEGLIAGASMFLRAMLVVIGFAAISTELRNPLIRNILYRKGFWQLYQALGLAFSALPYLMKHAAHPKKILKQPLQILTDNIINSKMIFEAFKMQKITSPVFVISGKRHEGKTTFLKTVIDSLKTQHLNAGGFLAHGAFENGKRSEFELENIQTGERQILCSIHGKENFEKIGKFYFYPEGIKAGLNALNIENIKKSDIVVIDELGPFELKNKGWASATEILLNELNMPHIWVIRNELVEDILRRFSITDAYIFDIATDKPEAVCKAITSSLNAD